jgi:L-threonylcarbamoyladenylate synthase
VAYPTETFYGLAVSVFDQAGCDRIFEIKGRPPDKALPCIVSDVRQLETVARSLPSSVRELAARFWPGPLTLVVSAQTTVAAASEAGTIAVRVSSGVVARELAALCGPITATSANRSGSSPTTTADEVVAQLGEAVDLVLDGGPTPGGVGSTIVDMTTTPPRLVREGAIRYRDVIAP